MTPLTLEERLQRLEKLQEFARSLSGTQPLETLLDQIVAEAFDLLDVEGVSILTYEPETEELFFRWARGKVAQHLVGLRIGLGQGISGQVALRRRPEIVNDVEADPRFDSSVDEETGFRTRALLAVPMTVQDELIGVLTAVNPVGGRPFTEEDAEWLSAVAALAAVAIRDARLYQEVLEERNRIVAAQEEVRRWLARELHDGPSQWMAAVAMEAEMVLMLIDRDPEEAKAEVLRLRERALRAVRETRALLFQLRPLVLETRGLVAAIETFVERFHSDAPVPIELDLAPLEGRRFAPAVERAAFGVVQEAVNNALKHGRPRRVTIRGWVEGERLILEVRDDGVGFDVEAALRRSVDRGSYGMTNLQERAREVGGQLRIESTPGQGTRVRVELPAQKP